MSIDSFLETLKYGIAAMFFGVSFGTGFWAVAGLFKTNNLVTIKGYRVQVYDKESRGDGQ